MIKLFLGKKDDEGRPLFHDNFLSYSYNIETAVDYEKLWKDSMKNFNIFLYDTAKNEILELTNLNEDGFVDKDDFLTNLRLGLIRMLPKHAYEFKIGIYSFEEVNSISTKYKLIRHNDEKNVGLILYENEDNILRDIHGLFAYFEFFKVTEVFSAPEKKDVPLKEATRILWASSKANLSLDEIPSMYPYNENISWEDMSENDAWLLSDDDRTVFWKLHKILPQELEKRIKNNAENIVMIPENGYIGVAGIRTIRLSHCNGDWIWIYNNNLNSNSEGKCIQVELGKWMKNTLSVYSKPNPLISFYYAEKITKEEAESYCKKKEQKYYYYNYICKPMDINLAIKSAKPIDNMLDFLFNNMKEELENIKPWFLASTYNEYEETEAIEKFGSFESKYCFNYKDNDFYVKKEKYYYVVCSLKHPQVTFESEQYFPNYYAGLNNKDFTNPVYDELVKILVNKNLVSKDCMTDFRGLLSVVKEIPKNAYEKQASNKYYYAIEFYNDSISTKYLQTNEDYSHLPFEVAYKNLVKYLIRDGILEKEHKIAVVKNITQSPLFKSSYEKQMAILEKTKTGKNLDAAFIILPHENGLNRKEINELLDIVNSEEVYTLDIEGDFSDAIGFISANSFDEKLDFNAKELSEYIEAILNDVELENSNETYHWRKKDMLFKMSHRKE